MENSKTDKVLCLLYCIFYVYGSYTCNPGISAQMSLNIVSRLSISSTWDSILPKAVQ